MIETSESLLKKLLPSVVLLLLSLSGCAANSQNKVFFTIRDALVHVGQAKEPESAELDRWLGSGFFVDNNCTIATAKHLFSKADRQRLLIAFLWPHKRSEGMLMKVKIIYEDTNRDLAFLQIVTREGKSCRSDWFNPLSIVDHVDNWDSLGGKTVYIAGFPRLEKESVHYPVIRKGIVASGEFTWGVHPILLLDLTGVPGFSGSPVVLETTKEVIGVVYGPGGMKRYSDFELATPITREDYEKAVGDSE
jgi:S1-C subfamily serine protease